MPRILMVASEAVPFVKTGGLADVLGALPAALVRLGETVAVVLPRYRSSRIDAAQTIWHQTLWLGPHSFAVSIDLMVRDGVQYFLIDCPVLYGRAGIYGEADSDYPDNHIRFGLLCQAALSIARDIFRTDVFHLHDWQAGLTAPLLRAKFAGDPTFLGSKCLLTIHNLGYQGLFPASAMDDLGLDRGLFQPEGLEFFKQVSFLKAGIVWADAVNTVSPTYAREIQTVEYGGGFDGLLRSRAHKLSGILNGVDYREWSPETDPYTPARYSAHDLSGKEVCKARLLDVVGLPPNLRRPLIGMISRFVDQKGFDLVAEAADWIARQDVALAVLGSGELRFEQMFQSFAEIRPDKFGVRIGYNNPLAHRIEAGADMFLMPSRYEPSGLNQMYSLRYGTVPIVRATGGLEDSVDEETGFKFSAYTPVAMMEAIGAALEAWRDPGEWRARMQRGMAKDYSWEASAARYQELYRSL